MQNELNEMNLDVTILGINHMDKDSANELMTEGRNVPWLQDLPATNVWSSWEIAYRDVVILNEDNEFVDRINVTTNNLTEAAGYQTLMGLITESISN